MKPDKQLSLNTQTLYGNLWINNRRTMNALDNGMQASAMKLIYTSTMFGTLYRFRSKRVSRFFLKLKNTSLKALKQEKKK